MINSFSIIIRFLFISLLTIAFTNAQTKLPVEKLWSADKKLTVEDYQIKTNSDYSSNKIYSQFAITHAISGFDFMKRNLNQKVENKFISSASWIDTTQTANEINTQIEYQQLQFDLAEIQARTIRKQVFANKKSISKGLDVVEQIINNGLVEFSNQRLMLFQETDGGRNTSKLKEWRSNINLNLQELDQFRFENTKRIEIED